jgi:hypothetical protein
MDLFLTRNSKEQVIAILMKSCTLDLFFNRKSMKQDLGLENDSLGSKVNVVKD